MTRIRVALSLAMFSFRILKCLWYELNRNENKLVYFRFCQSSHENMPLAWTDYWERTLVIKISENNILKCCDRECVVLTSLKNLCNRRSTFLGW